MKPELKAKWVAALRSGKYKQATKTLNNRSGGYCCLGVLLDVSGRGDWDGESFMIEADEENIYCNGDLGKRGCAEFSIPSEHEAVLICMNDGVDGHYPKTFSEIADYIEKKL